MAALVYSETVKFQEGTPSSKPAFIGLEASTEHVHKLRKCRGKEIRIVEYCVKKISANQYISDYPQSFELVSCSHSVHRLTHCRSRILPEPFLAYLKNFHL